MPCIARARGAKPSNSGFMVERMRAGARVEAAVRRVRRGDRGPRRLGRGARAVRVRRLERRGRHARGADHGRPVLRLLGRLEYTHSNPRLGQAFTYLAYKLDVVRGDRDAARVPRDRARARPCSAPRAGRAARPRPRAVGDRDSARCGSRCRSIGKTMFCRAYCANYVYGAAIQLWFLVPLRLVQARGRVAGRDRVRRVRPRGRHVQRAHRAGAVRVPARATRGGASGAASGCARRRGARSARSSGSPRSSSRPGRASATKRRRTRSGSSTGCCSAGSSATSTSCATS